MKARLGVCAAEETRYYMSMLSAAHTHYAVVTMTQNRSTAQTPSPHFSPITDERRFRVKESVAGESWTLGWAMRRNSWVSTAMRTAISASNGVT